MVEGIYRLRVAVVGEEGKKEEAANPFSDCCLFYNQKIVGHLIREACDCLSYQVS